MTLPALSLAVVGADYPNKGKSPTRRFEIALCIPGEPVDMRPEPKNPADEYAVAVFSVRDVHLGYLTAERAPWIGKLIREGREVQAVFQEAMRTGAVIRVAFDGEAPALPALKPAVPPPPEDSGFWPDPVWDD